MKFSPWGQPPDQSVPELSLFLSFLSCAVLSPPVVEAMRIWDFWPLKLKASWLLKRLPEGVCRSWHVCGELWGGGSPICLRICERTSYVMSMRTYLDDWVHLLIPSFTQPAYVKPPLRSTNPLTWGEGCKCARTNVCAHVPVSFQRIIGFAGWSPSWLKSVAP